MNSQSKALTFKANDADLPADQAQGNISEAHRYIVFLEQGSSKTKTEDTALALLESHGISTTPQVIFKNLNGFVIKLSRKQMIDLKASPQIRSIEEDGKTPELPDPTAPQAEEQVESNVRIFFKRSANKKDLLDRAETALDKAGIDAKVSKILSKKNGFIAKLTSDEANSIGDLKRISSVKQKHSPGANINNDELLGVSDIGTGFYLGNGDDIGLPAFEPDFEITMSKFLFLTIFGIATFRLS